MTVRILSSLVCHEVWVPLHSVFEGSRRDGPGQSRTEVASPIERVERTDSRTPLETNTEGEKEKFYG